MKRIIYLFTTLFLLSFFTGCDDLLEVESENSPTACFELPDSVFVGIPATFSGSCSENADGYDWSFGDGNYGYDSIVSHTFNSTGNFDVTLIVSNTDGTDEITKTVTVHATKFIKVENDIENDRTWDKDTVYIINENIYVKAVLTIQPGTVIKFGEDGSLNCNDGKIVANGMEQSPIIFTSLKDDTHGGDANGDGSATTPAKGDWEYIEIGGTNNASVFNYCHFYYAGGYYDYDYALNLQSAMTTVTNSTFAHNKSAHYGALNAYDAGENVTITGNVFYGNTIPLMINGYVDIDDSNIFHNPANTSNGNVKNAIYYSGSYGDIYGSRTWSETEVPFVIDEYDIYIGSGNTLTIGNNVVVKFQNDRMMDVDGGLLIAQGTETQPIVFTSIHDDSFGGDTEGNGTQITPAVADWEYIEINGTNNSSKMEYCHFYYGGGYYDYDYTLFLRSNNTVVKNCTFVNNKGSHYAVLNADDALSGTVITGNIFYNNIKPMSISGYLSIDDSNVFHNPNNPDEKNTKNGIYFTGTYGDIQGDVTWSETEVPFVIPDGAYDLLIDVGNSLTLSDNVILKFGINQELTHNNNLYNYNSTGVIFTSLKDDSAGGDTNGDGSTTSPATGDWHGVYNTVSDTYETWTNIKYAGN